jgi:hypothetical protein
VCENEAPKPFSKGAGLSSNRIEFSGKAIGAYRCGRFGGHKLGLLKPAHKVLSVCQPFDHLIDRCAYGIKKVEACVPADEDREGTSIVCRHSVLDAAPKFILAGPGSLLNLNLTVHIALDRLAGVS